MNAYQNGDLKTASTEQEHQYEQDVRNAARLAAWRLRYYHRTGVLSAAGKVYNFERPGAQNVE